MEEFIETFKLIPQPHALKCDVCGDTYRYGTTVDEDLEIQEFLRINFVGGYNSAFGDMNRIACDICQHCLKKMIGKHCRITDAMEEKNADLLL